MIKTRYRIIHRAIGRRGMGWMIVRLTQRLLLVGIASRRKERFNTNQV